MGSVAVSGGNGESERMVPAGRRAVVGAWLGYFADMFDIYLPVIALAPANIYFQSANLSETTAAILSAMVFAATLVGRPLGAFIFGHFGDKLGRRRTAIVSVGGFGVVTLLIGFMPGHEQIGLASIVILIVLRFVDGVFLGGEYTAATPLAMEYSPKSKRGYYGPLITTGFPVAYCLISALTLVMLQVAPAGGLHSPYVQWGWRIPFFVGALISLLFVLWYVFGVKESVVWQEAEKTSAPLKKLFSGTNLRDLVQVFVLMTGMWLSVNMATAVLPGTLQAGAKLTPTQLSVALIIANIILIGGYLAGGHISQRYGRRPFFIGNGILIAVAASIVFALIAGHAATGLLGAAILATVADLLVVSCFGVIATYLCERFAVSVRASGYGIGFSLAVVIPSFYAFFQTGLGSIMPFAYTPAALLVVGGVLISVGAAIGPETRDVDIGEPVGKKVLEGEATS